MHSLCFNEHLYGVVDFAVDDYYVIKHFANYSTIKRHSITLLCSLVFYIFPISVHSFVSSSETQSMYMYQLSRKNTLKIITEMKYKLVTLATCDQFKNTF